MSMPAIESPRELASHYKETKRRLWMMVPPQAAPAAPVASFDMLELTRLRQENKLFREFLQERGVDVSSVINKKKRISTDHITHPTIKEIVEAVAQFFLIEPMDIIAGRRTKTHVTPRHVAFYLATRLTKKSLPEIGRHIGGRDHTTVMHGRNRIERLILADAETAHDVARLMSEFGGR